MPIAYPPKPGDILPDLNDRPRWRLDGSLDKGGQAVLFRGTDLETRERVCVRIARHPDTYTQAWVREHWSAWVDQGDRAVARQKRLHERWPGAVPRPIARVHTGLVEAANPSLVLPYSVMEWLPGGDVDQALARLSFDGRITQAWNLLGLGFGALGRLHSLNASHDDATVKNFLLRRADDGGVALSLIDLDAGGDGDEGPYIRWAPRIWLDEEKARWVRRAVSSASLARRAAWDVIDLATSLRMALVGGDGHPDSGAGQLPEPLHTLLRSIQRGLYPTAALARAATEESARAAGALAARRWRYDDAVREASGDWARGGAGRLPRAPATDQPIPPSEGSEAPKAGQAGAGRGRAPRTDVPQAGPRAASGSVPRTDAPQAGPRAAAGSAPRTDVPQAGPRAAGVSAPRTDVPQAGPRAAGRPPPSPGPGTAGPPPPASRPPRARFVAAAAGLTAVIVALAGSGVAGAAAVGVRERDAAVERAWAWCDGANPAGVTCDRLTGTQLADPATRASFDAVRGELERFPLLPRTAKGRIAAARLDRQACVLSHEGAACVGAASVLEEGAAEGALGASVAANLALLQEHAHLCDGDHQGIADALVWIEAAERWAASDVAPGAAARALARARTHVGDAGGAREALRASSSADPELRVRNARLAGAWACGLASDAALDGKSAEATLTLGCGWLALGEVSLAEASFGEAGKRLARRGLDRASACVIEPSRAKDLVNRPPVSADDARCQPLGGPR